MTQPSNAILKRLAPLFLLLGLSAGHAGDVDCLPDGDLEFVCGFVDPEDLVSVDDSPWIIVSSLTPGDGLYAIDARDRSWTALTGANAPAESHDLERYPSCPGAPSGDYSTHGLYIAPASSGRHRLYAVVHGSRESIEVYDIDATGDAVELTWIGCAMLPEGLAANSVAALDDGSLLATVPLLPDRTLADAMRDEPTGAVYAWSATDDTWTRVDGSELPYGNGIEVSFDETEFYVASSGRPSVVAFANDNPTRVLRKSEPLDFVPDNLRFGPDGNLLTAGLMAVDKNCGDVRAAEFDLAEFAACPRPFKVSSFDPDSMAESVVTRQPARAAFSNITMAIVKNDELWIGTFAGDRVAVRPLAAGGEAGVAAPAAKPDSTALSIDASDFKCLDDMKKVRHFFVDNLLGDLDATVAVAESVDGGQYPPGSVVQLVPTEVMVKHRPGWNAVTRDWEFFELDVSADGSSIRNRGFTDVVNKFGGNCFGCHVRAEPKFDLICEQDHGCDPIPITREMIADIQAKDPRCID